MDIWFFIYFLEACLLALLIVMIFREIITFFYEFIKYALKKKKKIKKGFFYDFWDSYKFLNFKDLFIGRFIKF